MASEYVKQVQGADFDTFLGEKKLALVDFWANWCGYCHALAPVIEQIAEEYADTVAVGKVDADSNGAIAAQFDVMGLPTVLLFENGREVDRLVGAMPKEAYRQMIQKHL